MWKSACVGVYQLLNAFVLLVVYCLCLGIWNLACTLWMYLHVAYGMLCVSLQLTKYFGGVAL